MRTLFRLLVVLPLAVLIVLFAVANRHLVMVSFDPFPGNDIQGPQLTAPLFLLLFWPKGSRRARRRHDGPGSGAGHSRKQAREAKGRSGGGARPGRRPARQG
ncbi:MAG: hypothetical protein U1E30_03220 [Rhodoblastus sp.]